MAGEPIVDPEIEGIRTMADRFTQEGTTAPADRDGGGRLYRITVRAWGRNANSVVTLQSYYVVP